MKIFVLLFCLLLAACETAVPVKQKFPEVPASLMEPCTNLEYAPAGTKELSVLLETVVKNYGHYRTCRSMVESWQEWYNEQKRISQ